MENEAMLNVYRAARTIKRRENTLYNALRSIYEDSIFVGEIAQLWPELPFVANLRCGLWYSPNFHSTCYFKSTDGHTNNWSFNISRLNFHIALLAGQKGGCIIVDSTRRGKRFPDSMSKTIPIWACVLNRSISAHLDARRSCKEPQLEASHHQFESREEKSVEWDCSLHLPLWVSETEKAAIEDRLEGWTKELDASGADIVSLASCLRKPLRPLWISQKTVIWLNEVPDHDSWDFTPIILVSASSSYGVTRQRITSEFSWNYIPGAGDDEESWARGLHPSLFWKHAYDLINSVPDLCNQKVADIVEKERVYRSQRGQNAPQITAKPQKSGSLGRISYLEQQSSLDISSLTLNPSDEECAISWLASTSIAVGPSQLALGASNVDCILNCDQKSISVHIQDTEAYLHLPILNSKLDRFSLFRNLPAAVSFAKFNLSKGRRVLVCCQNGEDISICVSLAILISLFDDGGPSGYSSSFWSFIDNSGVCNDYALPGTFDSGKSFSMRSVTKVEMRRHLMFICKYATNARPSRGNLKQVFGYLSTGKVASD